MSIFNTQDTQVWRKEIDNYILEGVNNRPAKVCDMLYDIQTTNQLQINDVQMAKVGYMEQVGETSEAEADEPIDGYQYVYNQARYSKKASFSSALMESDLTGNKVMQKAIDLVDSLENSRELRSLSMFRRAWDSTLTYGDAKTLISTAHPRKDGGADQSNTFADGVQKPLTYSNVEELEGQMISFVDNNGNLMNAGGKGKKKCILTSSANRVKAFQIAGVNGAINQPDTDLNNKNYYTQGDKYDVITTDWLGYEAARAAGEFSGAKTSEDNFYDSMWFLIDLDLAKKYAKMYKQQGYETGKYFSELDNSTLVTTYFAHDKYAYGNSGFYFIVGSKGDNSTYTG